MWSQLQGPLSPCVTTPIWQRLGKMLLCFQLLFRFHPKGPEASQAGGRGLLPAPPSASSWNWFSSCFSFQKSAWSPSHVPAQRSRASHMPLGSGPHLPLVPQDEGAGVRTCGLLSVLARGAPGPVEPEEAGAPLPSSPRHASAPYWPRRCCFLAPSSCRRYVTGSTREPPSALATA